MTWIVGRTIPFGYSVALSDIRVTLGDGREVDCLQKIYPVGPFIAMGFAGSVSIGFAMIERARQLMNPLETGMAWEPDVVAEWWPSDAREVFAAMSSEAQENGCHLLMIGAHPSKNNGDSSWAMSYVFRFRSPNFEATSTRADEVVSIGSGEGVTEYMNALERMGGISEEAFQFLQLEQIRPGGSAWGLMQSISHVVESTPTPGISHHLHVCLALRGEIRLSTNNRETIGGDTSTDVVMPPVATTMEQLIVMLNLSAEAAADARC